MDKDIKKVTAVIQKWFDKAMWVNAPEAMRLKSELDILLPTLYRLQSTNIMELDSEVKLGERENE
jgi:hypothetical protein